MCACGYIGFSGSAEAGKTSCAEAVVAADPRYREVWSFADAIKKEARALGWDGVKDDGGRRFLQDLGMAGRRYREDFWVNRLEVAVALSGWQYLILIDDVRFVNECEFIRQKGGRIIRVVRPGHRGLIGELAAHPSETELASLSDSYFDAVIVNNRSLEELAHEAIATVVQLRSGRLR